MQPVLSRCLATLAVVTSMSTEARDLTSACTPQPMELRSQVFRCVVPSDAASKRLRFEADFSGSHDDTQLALDVRIDGALVPCAAGSKVESEREDGDVRLSCVLAVEGPVVSGKSVEVEVRRYHAEPAGWRFLAD